MGRTLTALESGSSVGVAMTTNPVTGIFGSGRVRVFATSDDFTIPAESVRVRLWGGGGSDGGHGGGFAIKEIHGLTVGDVVAVTVGEGGLDSDLSDGGTSSFGAYVSATGGSRSTGSAGNGVGGDINYSGGLGVVGEGGGGAAGIFGPGGDAFAGRSGGNGCAGAGAGNATNGACGGNGMTGRGGRGENAGSNGDPGDLSCLDFIATGGGGGQDNSDGNGANGGGGAGNGHGGIPAGGGGRLHDGARGQVIVEW